MSFADDRALRQQCYQAYVTRASDQGPHAGQWDNNTFMQNILQHRYEKARLLGFNNYAELSLATKMANNPTEVFTFLYDLLQQTKPRAEKEFQELQEFAAKHCHIKQLAAWDIAYASEKRQQHLFAISQQQLRPYFPEQQVINGLFAITHRLFGIHCEPVDDVDRWDPQIQVYAIYDAKQELCGHFYFDLYARDNKRSGAWVNDCVPRVKLPHNTLQTPIAFVNCNFAPPTDKTPCLLTHDDVITLFHEFGHCLHHILTKMDIADISGINGVMWDAVELPSQFLENWCWQQKSLSLFAKHFETNEPLPDDIFNKLNQLKHFQAAMHLLRQLEFALVDFHLHHDFPDQTNIPIQEVINKVRQQTNIIPTPDYNRFQHSFSHIFAGGYAAGYYSYLWAEVLSTDAFARFTETSLFNAQASHDFLHHILERGGSKDMIDCFIAFRGRKPQIEALLKEYGIIPIMNDAQHGA
jgi:oligopeptidase A